MPTSPFVVVVVKWVCCCGRLLVESFLPVGVSGPRFFLFIFWLRAGGVECGTAGTARMYLVEPSFSESPFLFSTFMVMNKRGVDFG